MSELKMDEWEFEHSIVTIANRKDAWAYWSDVRSHAKMEPGVERIELDGPFETGTTGRTVMETFTQEWTLTDVAEGERWEITGHTPDGSLTLRFRWTFEDEGDGTRMTQTIRATGADVEAHAEVLHQMETNAPNAMARLAATLDRRARKEQSA